MGYDIAKSQLDRMEGVLEDVASSIANGERMYDIARRLGVKQGELGYWLTSDGDRALRYASALKACSHNVLLEGLDRVRESVDVVDGVGEWGGLELDERKGRADVRVKVGKLVLDYAGVMNPERYGRQGEVGGMVVGALTAVLREISERKRAVLEVREERVIEGYEGPI